jgi:hypothetical protein
MINRIAMLLACSIALLPHSLRAQDAVIEVPGTALNDLIAQLGSPSASGNYLPPAPAPPGSPLPWQWWVTDAHFSLAPGALSFTATVLSQVGGQNFSKTMTVPASIVFDGTSSSLRISIASFVVPIQSGNITVAQVDVANIYGLSVPIEPQTFVVSLPQGGVRSVTGRVTGATMAVQSAQVVLNLAVGF